MKQSLEKGTCEQGGFTLKDTSAKFIFLMLCMVWHIAAFSQNSDYDGPIIDMHFHLDPPESIPPVPMGLCLPFSNMVSYFDPQTDFEEVWIDHLMNPKCENPFWFSKTYEEYKTGMIAEILKHKVTPMASASIALHNEWSKELPNNLIRGFAFRIGRDSITADSLERLILAGKIDVLGEISNQYANIPPNDPRMFPYYEIAQKHDIPVGIHLGSGLPGIMYHWEPEYRAQISNPLVLEEVLRKFPKLRIYVMHYGDPFIDEMITMLYHYPQLYIDLGGIQWNYPKEYFYEYHLKKFVTAGFGKRILFGSDTILSPQLLAHSIGIIQEAPFLTKAEKADIFYNNAVRFLRMDQSKN